MGIYRALLVSWLTLIFLLWQHGHCLSQEIDFQRIQKQYPQRQTHTLEQIAESESKPLKQAAAFFFLNQNPKRVNTLLRLFDGEDAHTAEYSLVMRILASNADKNSGLEESAIRHLETEMAQWIQTRSLEAPKVPSIFLNTENQEILTASIQLLWSGYIDKASPAYRWPGKKTSGEQKILHNNTANQWLERRIRHGFTHRSSPQNYACLAALFNLRDLCDDRNLAVKADSVIDILLADLVQESIQSQWGSVHCRDLESIYPVPCNRLQHILFDFPLESSLYTIDDCIILHLCQSGYRPPSIWVRLAHEYQFRGTYEIKNCFPLPGGTDTIEKYSYITPSLILSSFHLRNERVPVQSRPWDLMVTDEKGKGHHLFTFTGTELASGGILSPEEESYFWNADCFQYKNVLFCQFSRSGRKRAATSPDDPVFMEERYAQFPTRIWIPNSFDAATQEGDWWFSRLGSVFLAFRPLSGRSYWWRTAGGGPGVEDSASILTFQNLHTAFLLETESATHFTSFEQFKNQVIHSPMVIDNDTVTFVSRRGDVYLFPLGEGDFLVNGRTVDPATDPSYKLFNSPFIQSEYGSGIIKAEWQTHSLTIDISDPNNPKRIVKPE